MKTKFLLLAITGLTLLLIACSKNETTPNNARLQISLTDDPGNFEVVNIDVQDVRINYSNDTAKGWISLPDVKVGNYDVLRLANGRDALLANAEIRPGKLRQIRLVLGTNNFVKVDGQIYPLKTPGAHQAGLKLRINQDVQEGVSYKLLMDFDASRSVVQTGNRNFLLKPVIRATLDALGGSVKGVVLPNDFATAVYALRGTDTLAGTYTVDGSYMLKGLDAGTYSLAFVPGNTHFKQQLKTGINVMVNKVTMVDTTKLVQ